MRRLTEAAWAAGALHYSEATARCPDESWLASSHRGARAEQNYTCLYASVYTAQPTHTSALKDTFSQTSESATKIQFSKPARQCCHRKWHLGICAGTGKKQEENLVFKWHRANFLAGESRLSVLRISPCTPVLALGQQSGEGDRNVTSKNIQVWFGKKKEQALRSPLILRILLHLSWC